MFTQIAFYSFARIDTLCIQLNSSNYEEMRRSRQNRALGDGYSNSWFLVRLCIALPSYCP